MEQQIENNAGTTESAGAPSLPGIVLREARERLGLTVADAAAQTKLAPRQIEALEADDYQRLPEMAFVRGFVRSYAKVLQLDAQSLLAALPQATPSASHVSPVSVDVPFPDARSPQLQNLIWLGAALFLSVVVVAFAVWHYTTPSTPAEPEPSQPVEAAIPLPAQMPVIPASAVDEAFASSVASAVPGAQSSVLAAQSAVPATQVAPIAAMAPVSAMTVNAMTPVMQPQVKQPLAVSAVKPVPVAAKPLPVSAVAVAKPAPVAAKPLPVSAVAATKPVAAAAKPLPVSAVAATKPAPLAAKPAPIPAAPAVKPTAPVATPAAAQPGSLRLSFGEESWTEVRDRNGNIVSSQLNPAGSELRLSGQGPFTLVVGRASSARLTYKGKTIDLKPSTNATSDVARVTLE